MKKELLILSLLIIFAFLQNSFFAYFAYQGAVPNIVLIYFFYLCFFESKKGKTWFFASLIFGLLLGALFAFPPWPALAAAVALGIFARTAAKICNKNFLTFLAGFAVFYILFFIFKQMISTGFMTDAGAYWRNFGKEIFYNMFFALIFYYIRAYGLKKDS